MIEQLARLQDIGTIRRIRQILDEAGEMPTAGEAPGEVMTARALRSREDVRAGRVFTREAAEAEVNKRLGL